MEPIYQRVFEQAKPFLRTRKNLIHARIALRYAARLLHHEKGEEEIVIPASSSDGTNIHRRSSQIGGR